MELLTVIVRCLVPRQLSCDRCDGDSLEGMRNAAIVTVSCVAVRNASDASFSGLKLHLNAYGFAVRADYSIASDCTQNTAEAGSVGQ
ncbi:hypothetical protein LOC67_23945 [Stieleria sp. JC731]|uniref:hypothetical protein n=1 Tax=Pirellulaceae TaxID=2691357 RepID=UPI001E6432DD|nr:hypothetical protein [Stieleria sp. JC731]MCC9603614.1 hypothetical protein [Stieleria sp. JC731]